MLTYHYILFIVLTFCSFQQNLFPCSSLHLSEKENNFVVKSYDWPFGGGYLIANKRQVKKQALLMSSSKPAEWVSKYGSVTFNQFGQELPTGGMNEHGLVVEILWLNNSVYPQPSHLPTISEAQWIQYQLDNFQSTAEVMEHVHNINIEKIAAPVHYFICDAVNDCAVVELLDGKITPYGGLAMMEGEYPVHVVTNDPYLSSRKSLRGYRDFGGRQEWPFDLRRLPRFLRGARRAMQYCETCVESRPYAFSTLNIMKSANTQWQIVYDIKNRTIHYRSALTPKIKVVDIDWLDYDCQKPVQALDINHADLEGKVEKYFTEYTIDKNRQLSQKAATYLPHEFSSETLEKVIQYPFVNLKCFQ